MPCGGGLGGTCWRRRLGLPDAPTRAVIRAQDNGNCGRPSSPTARRPIPARNSAAAACAPTRPRYRLPAIMSRPPVPSACPVTRCLTRQPRTGGATHRPSEADHHGLVVLLCDSRTGAADVVLRRRAKRRSTGMPRERNSLSGARRARRSDQHPDGEAGNRTGCAERPLRVQGAKTFSAIACLSRSQASPARWPASSPRIRAV